MCFSLCVMTVILAVYLNSWFQGLVSNLFIKLPTSCVASYTIYKVSQLHGRHFFSFLLPGMISSLMTRLKSHRQSNWHNQTDSYSKTDESKRWARPSMPSIESN